MAWSKNKLYVSVDWQDEGSTVRRTFIYDPSLGQNGAWMATDIDAGPLFAHRPPNSETILMGGCVANTGRVIHIDDDAERVFDQYATSEANIQSYFVTPWVSTKNPIVSKRWGKPQMVTLAKSSLQLTTEIYKDYDFAEASKSFLVEIVGRTSAAAWNSAVWNTDSWGSAADARVTDVKRLPTLGTGRAICMKIIGPSTNAEWQVNAIGFTYVPRRMR